MTASRISIPPKWISLSAVAIWLLLFAAQMGWLPGTRFAWAFNLWSYFPGWVGFLIQAAALALCLPRARETVIRACSAAAARFAGLPSPARDAILFVSATALLWHMRERVLIADSILLLHSAHLGWLFVFPDVGSTFLIRSVVQADVLAIDATARLQLTFCLCGGLAVLLAIRVARRLTLNDGAGAAIIVMLLLTSGMARVFAGHVETYPFVLCASLFYFWMALAYLDGDVGWLWPCLALGIAGWLHLSVLFLVPSLIMLPRLASPDIRARDWVARLAGGAPIAMLPMIGFWVVAYLLGFTEDIERGLHIVKEVIAGAPTEDGLNKQWWVRVGDDPADVGIDYVFLSRAHLKYLANAAHMLMPFTPLILIAIALRKRAAFTPTMSRLFLYATIPTVVYAFMLRPFWGPFDWDLFAITALCGTLLAGQLLVRNLEAGTRAHVATCLIGFQVLFVGLPFLVLGVVQPRDSGPFGGAEYVRGVIKLRAGMQPPDALAPWL